MPLDGVIHARLRTANRLTALKVAKLKVPRLYEDGSGLRLVVTATGTKRWVLRLTINGHQVERGLGVWPEVSELGRCSAKSRAHASGREGRHRD